MTIEDLSGFHDEYREALENIIAAKAEGKPLPAPAEDEGKERGQVVDLMAALNASVKAAKESRGEDGENATVHEMRPSKKTTGKTPARKRAAPKKSTASTKPAKKAAAKKRSAS
ncbi:Ku protein, partial [Streptomyces californicus]|nr:Ku protein [Streptomyces californicus]